MMDEFCSGILAFTSVYTRTMLPRDSSAEILASSPPRPLSPATLKLRMLRSLACGLKYEKAARATGATRIAGVDEVGRGSLFGPVVAAAVILPEGCRIRGLRDSKQLTPEDRERLAAIVRARALCIAIEEIDAATIDRVNIYQATRMAMLRAVLALAPRPDHLLIDAMRLDHTCAQTSIIYGDSLSISIAAASVVAKVYRDRRMCEYHRLFPAYGLDSHKGYSTPEHMQALRRHGPTPLHRHTFRPVAQSSLPWDLWREEESERCCPDVAAEQHRAQERERCCLESSGESASRQQQLSS